MHVNSALTPFESLVTCNSIKSTHPNTSSVYPISLVSSNSQCTSLQHDPSSFQPPPPPPPPLTLVLYLLHLPTIWAILSTFS